MTDRGYERISLDNERSGSIGKQTSQINKHGNDVVHYTDESVSGSKIPFAQRPEGGRLLSDLRPGDRVLVTKIDRAARNVRDLLDLVARIEDAGCSIVFVEQNIDTSGPMGKFILVLLAAIAELEANIIGERRRESLAVFAQEGRHAVGAAPFGFVSVENPDGRGLVIRPDWTVRPPWARSHAEMLRDAISCVLTGESQSRVSESLPIKKAGFSALLRNPRIAGITTLPDGNVRVDPDAGLLSLAQWHDLREFMKQPEKKAWARQDGYGAVLSCSACGMRLYKSAGAYTVYKCGRAKHERGTPSASVRQDAADAHLEKVFLEEHGDRPLVKTVVTDSADAKYEAIALAQIRLETAQDAFAKASDDETEDEALLTLRASKRALKEAQEMPTERVTQPMYTGETVAEAWGRADDGQRCKMLAAAGTWLVHPGRGLAIEDRIELTPDELLMELRTFPVGEGEDAPVGFLL